MTGKLPVFNIERFAIHDGEGIRTAVFLQGCPLRCPWCANPESQVIGEKLMFLQKKCAGCGTCVQRCPQRAVSLGDGYARIDRSKCVRCGVCASVCPQAALKISGQWMTAEEIFAVVVRDADYYRQTHGGLTLSGGEALLHIDALLPLLRECNEVMIPVDFETCGHVPSESIEKALPWTERFLFDVKTADANKFRRFTGGNLELVLKNLTIIAENDPQKLIIRVPVIPTLNHTAEEIQRILEIALSLGISRVDLLPYHTLGLTKYAQLGQDYSFSEKKSLSPESLQPYADMGKKLGLTVTIGG